MDDTVFLPYRPLFITLRKVVNIIVRVLAPVIKHNTKINNNEVIVNTLLPNKQWARTIAKLLGFEPV